MVRAVLVGLSVALLASNCGPRVQRTKASLPADVQIRMARVDDVWVAGFVAGAGKDNVDVNVETVRLVRQNLRRASRARVVEAEPLTLASEDVFDDAAYWRRQAEDRQARLIVTGASGSCWHLRSSCSGAAGRPSSDNRGARSTPRWSSLTAGAVRL